MNTFVKTVFWSCACGAALSTAAALGEAIQTIDTEHVFIPKGFDDNDIVQIVLDGNMNSTCYHKTDSIVKVDPESKLIDIQARANVVGGPCLLVLVPFTEVIELGSLPEGRYTVKVVGAPSQFLEIIPAASAGPDDELYVPVENTNVFVIPETQTIQLELRGHFPNSCMVVDKIKVVDSEDTIEVSPIAKVLEREDCRDVDFEYMPIMVNLPWRSSGRYLVHVRSFNGKSLNQVFSVYGG